MQIKDIMTSDPITIKKDAKVNQAVKLLALHEIGRLLVLDGNELIGVVTDGDLMVEDDHSTDLINFMSGNLIICYETDSIEEVAREMKEYKIGGLPVFNSDEELVGIVTVEDIVFRYVAR